MNIQELLTQAIERKASDLHISDHIPPRIRIDGELVSMNVPAAAKRTVIELLTPVMTKEHLQEFKDRWEVDC
jgi:twitching motility protein PilT